MQTIITLQQLFSGNTASALFWRTLFGSPLEVVALAAIIAALVMFLMVTISELCKYNIIRAAFGAVLTYILFVAITSPFLGEEATKMTAYTVSAYIFFMEAVAKDPAFLNYLTLLGGAIAWIAKTTAVTVQWTLVQLERLFSYSLVATQFCLSSVNAFIDATAAKLFFLWIRIQEERLRKATRTVEVKAEASDK
jgi:hypothetical protein